MLARLLVAVALGAAVCISGCGGTSLVGVRGTAVAPPPPPRPAFGLTEANPHLLSPARQPAAFTPWRDHVAALRPAYVRVFFDWAKAGDDLAAVQDGCLRGLKPCAPYRGIADQLRAIAARQFADPGRWRLILTVYGVPARYAAPPSGCERADATFRARPITPEGLMAYRRLLDRLFALAHRVGAQIAYLSPWNEPNHPAFVSPQRAACDVASPSLAPGVYTQLAGAAAGLPRRPPLMLGELAGYVTSSPRTTAVAEFVGALPQSLSCVADAWSVHDYAQPDGGSPDSVGALRAALDAQPCTAGRPIFVTETGAGGDRVGGPRSADPAAPAAACRALEAKYARWAADDRVAGILQYSFREDPAYPVGLADAQLTRLYPTYGLLKAWSTTGRDPGPGVCG